MKKYIILTGIILLAFTTHLFAQETNKIKLTFNELSSPIELDHKNIKVQKFGAFLKLNAFGRTSQKGYIIPIDITLSLPKFDYETPQKHTYKNADNHYIDASKDASMTIKIGDDSYSTFYRFGSGDGNSKSETTDYTMIVHNNIEKSVPMVNVNIQPGSFLSTSINSGGSEIKRLTFSNAEQIFEIINPYPEGLKPVIGGTK